MAVALYALDDTTDADTVALDKLHLLGVLAHTVAVLHEKPPVGWQGIGKHEVLHLPVGNGQYDIPVAVGRGLRDKLHGGILLAERLQVTNQVVGGVDEYHVMNGRHLNGIACICRGAGFHGQEILYAHVVELVLDALLAAVSDVHGEPVGIGWCRCHNSFYQRIAYGCSLGEVLLLDYGKYLGSLHPEECRDNGSMTRAFSSRMYLS